MRRKCSVEAEVIIGAVAILVLSLLMWLLT